MRNHKASGKASRKSNALLGFVLILLVSSNAFAATPPIFMAAVLPVTGGVGTLIGSSMKLSFNMSVQDYASTVPHATVSNLPLDTYVHNDMSSPERGVFGAIGHIMDNNAVGIVGAWNSGVTIEMSYVCNSYTTPAMTPMSTSPTLASKVSFPALTRGVTNDQIISGYWARFMVNNKWKQYAAIGCDDSFCSGALTAIKDETAKLGITTMEKIAFTSDASSITAAVTAIKESGAKIIYAVMYGDPARACLEEAVKQGILGTEEYLWLGNAWVEDSLFSNNWGFANEVRGSLAMAPGLALESFKYLSFASKFAAADPTLKPMPADAPYTYDTTTFMLTALAQTTKDLAGFGLSAACLNFKHFDANRGTCSITTTLRQTIYDRSICKSGASDCDVQLGVSNLLKHFAPTDGSSEWSPHSLSPSALYLQNIYQNAISGATGTFILQTDGERKGISSLKNLQTTGTNDQFSYAIADVGSVNSLDIIVDDTKIVYGGGTVEEPNRKLPEDGSAPPASETDPIPAAVGGAVGGAAVIGIVVAIYLWHRRKQELEKELQNLSWLIHMEDITLQEGTGGASRSSMNSKGSLGSAASKMSRLGQVYITIGLYKGETIALKKVYKESVEITRTLRVEVRNVRELRHSNVNPFLGATLDPGQIYLLYDYCVKGSLEDVLANDKMQLDDIFKYAMMQDCCKGMQYIHASPIVAHGALKSSNCLIDSRWVLRVTDIGFEEFRDGEEKEDEDENAQFVRKYWMAPEHAKEGQVIGFNGSQKGDVYSFGIIVQEIITRELPYAESDLEPNDIVRRVVKMNMRPEITAETPGELAELMKTCWETDPEMRPDFSHCFKEVKRMNPSKSGSVMDNMAKILEKYIAGLKETIAVNTEQLMDKKAMSEELLYELLPSVVAEKLVRGDPVEPCVYPNASILFSDIVGFATVCDRKNAKQVVTFLNDIYDHFDKILLDHDCFKIETIGDTYMVVSGCPKANGRNHAIELTDLAMNCMSEMSSMKVKHSKNHELKLRVGVHSGQLTGGVVGLKIPRFVVFGAAVHQGARVESHAPPQTILVSSTTKEILDSIGGFHFEKFDEIPAKKGKPIETFKIMGRDGFKKKFPKPS
eukprot:Nk52_evm88s1810 gene=Nk52_evmTU88s1810